MNLNEADARLIQRLKMRQKSWPLVRWAALAIGSLMIGACVFLFQGIWITMSYDYILLTLCTSVAPALGIALFVGAAAVSYVFAFWNGRPNDKLLLRLADEVEARRSS
jgi:H+/Cl- antiporter ClcA